jgi:hypothetical protein
MKHLDEDGRCETSFCNFDLRTGSWSLSVPKLMTLRYARTNVFISSLSEIVHTPESFPIEIDRLALHLP